MTQHTTSYTKLAYILTLTILFLPVLLWPLPILLVQNPMLYGVLIPTWTFCIAALLLVSIGMDSMLYPIQSFKQALHTTLWVVFITTFTIATLQNEASAWVLGTLFLIHSFRSASQTMGKQNTHWWMWFAWARDIISSITVFLWLYLLP